ncbi:hydrolase, alpha/beta domain protein [Gleimia coleocanis DSM 15436]|uniref:Hydrolase, alpha/beta domain protein n=1 Tax=Gleimia coleocanis DSM 15436 TaxID=525245 RepID=C0VYZ1_9ACTO|nr:alpha/beta fold hydrolase [Gleimia coleocanis]EEH64644.1 hydrolase, alpha/beta domain protein [Gleimia coleocanis DSM 15436]
MAGKYHVIKGVFNAGGVRVRVTQLRRDFVDEGDPTFVLVHGIGVNSQYFQDLAELLVPFGDVLMLDLPGFGKTPRPAFPLSIAGFAAVVHQVMLYEKVTNPVVLGHSMGAQIVTELACRDPKWIRKIMLVGPPINVLERAFPLVVWRFVQSSWYEASKVTSFAIKAYLQSGLVWFAKTIPAMFQYPIACRLAETDARVVLMRGEFDFIASRTWMQDLLLATEHNNPHPSKVLEVKGGAHSVIVRFRNQVAQALLDLAAEPAFPSKNSLGVLFSVSEANAVAEQSVVIPNAVLKPLTVPQAYARDYLVAAKQSLSAVKQNVLTNFGVGDCPSVYRNPGGLPVVLVPGVYESWYQMRGLASYLKERGFDPHLLPQLGNTLGPVDLLARRVLAYLHENNLRDVFLVGHSKGGLVSRCVQLEADLGVVRGIVTLGTPHRGARLAAYTLPSSGVRDLVPTNPLIQKMFADTRFSDRVVCLQARWDQHVPEGASLLLARLEIVDVVGHNRLITEEVAFEACVRALDFLR